MHAQCAKTKRIATVNSASGGDLKSVRAFGAVIQHLGDSFQTWRQETRVTFGVYVGNHPDRALLRMLDPTREIRFHTPPPLAELDIHPRDGTCLAQDVGDAVVSKKRLLTVKKMSTTDR